ncbi:MAG: hypothetical protein Q8Q33_04485 [Chlamydiota bacterium]|nr:hypothetical protein [Chlamydiota bacterium]
MKIDNSNANRRNTLFKKCPSCGHDWDCRDAFLNDPNVLILGYQVNFSKLEAGTFLFNHSCKTTLALRAGVFKDLYDGPIFLERLLGEHACPGYCLHQNDMRPCPEACECAYVTQVIQQIKDWPKQVT